MKLEQALNVSEQDVKDASAGVLKDLKRFQLEKEDDLRRYMVRLRFRIERTAANTHYKIAYARCHIDWAKKNVDTWRGAKEEVDQIEVR